MSLKFSGIAQSLPAQLLLFLGILLFVAFVGVQYENDRAHRQVQEVLEAQNVRVKATTDQQFTDVGAAMGFASSTLGSKDYIYEILARQDEDGRPPILNRQRIKHILIADASGRISDSTEQEFVDKTIELPKSGSEEFEAFSQPNFDPVAAYETHGCGAATNTYWIRVRTRGVGPEGTSEYTWIGVVYSTAAVSDLLLKSQQQIADVVASTAREQFIVTVAILLVLLVLILVGSVLWVTNPLQQLSQAAERVANGDLDFEVGIRRRDEIGHLSRTFDEMIGGLKAKAELEDRLNNAERAAVIGRLTAAIAHEIRNPLNFINLSIDHVRSKYPPPETRDRERFEQLLGSVKEETARLNRLVADVLNFGRPANLNTRAIDLRTIVDQAIALGRGQAEQQNVAIEVHLPPTVAEVTADAEKLKSCFSNIVINAVQSMGAGGTLTITMERTEGGYRTRIEDTGSGIPEDALDRIFEPYYSTKDTGTGLGLAVTKKIVDEHGGSIRVSSLVGRGTTFEVDLPFERPGAHNREPVQAEVRA